MPYYHGSFAYKASSWAYSIYLFVIVSLLISFLPASVVSSFGVCVIHPAVTPGASELISFISELGPRLYHSGVPCIIPLKPQYH